MSERLLHVRMIVWATILETVRRKDLYVVWMLAACGVAAGASLSVIGVRGKETFIRDITLGVVNLLSVSCCVWLAARQMPEELARRTLFPLLARPVRRFDVLFGKFLAVWLLSGVALVVLAGTAWGMLYVQKAAIGRIFLDYLALRFLSFGPIAALTITLSLVLSQPATVILSGLLTLCATLFARTIADVVREGSAAAPVFKAIYFTVPHFDLFDLSQRASFNYPPIAAGVIGALVLYAAAYATLFLSLGAIRFRKMAV